MHQLLLIPSSYFHPTQPSPYLRAWTGHSFMASYAIGVQHSHAIYRMPSPTRKIPHLSHLCLYGVTKPTPPAYVFSNVVLTLASLARLVPEFPPDFRLSRFHRSLNCHISSQHSISLTSSTGISCIGRCTGETPRPRESLVQMGHMIDALGRLLRATIATATK